MIKVRILQGVTAAGAAALALPSLAGCTTRGDARIRSATTPRTTPSRSPARATSRCTRTRSHYTSTSGGDEFLRVGEKMTVAVAWNDVLDKLAYQYDPAQAALRAALSADPEQGEADAEAHVHEVRRVEGARRASR